MKTRTRKPDLDKMFNRIRNEAVRLALWHPETSKDAKTRDQLLAEVNKLCRTIERKIQ